MRNPTAFFSTVRTFTGALTTSQVAGFNHLISEMVARPWPLAYAANGFGTVWHETAGTMLPVKEYGGAAYFRDRYDIEGDNPSLARELGNMTPGDGARFCGRGYVQVTGRKNYQKVKDVFGVDCISNPDLLLDPSLSARVMIYFMENGLFTGKGCHDYLPSSGPASENELVEARRIINGTDCCTAIALQSLKFQTALTQEDGNVATEQRNRGHNRLEVATGCRGWRGRHHWLWCLAR